jgi:hypothetical protein
LDWRVVQAKIRIVFDPEQVGRRQKVVTAELRLPNWSNLKKPDLAASTRVGEIHGTMGNSAHTVDGRRMRRSGRAQRRPPSLAGGIYILIAQSSDIDRHAPGLATQSSKAELRHGDVYDAIPRIRWETDWLLEPVKMKITTANWLEANLVSKNGCARLNAKKWAGYRTIPRISC